MSAPPLSAAATTAAAARATCYARASGATGATLSTQTGRSAALAATAAPAAIAATAFAAFATFAAPITSAAGTTVATALRKCLSGCENQCGRSKNEKKFTHACLHR
jgi:hypothetical protein